MPEGSGPLAAQFMDGTGPPADDFPLVLACMVVMIVLGAWTAGPYLLQVLFGVFFYPY